MAKSDNDNASPTERWADDVVEGAAAAKSAESGPGGIVHELAGDEDEMLFSTPVPDEPPVEVVDGSENNDSNVGKDDSDDVELVDAGGAVEDGPALDDSSLGEPFSVEGLISDLERVTQEKNQYLDTSRRLQADFENYKKRVAKDTSDAKIRGKESVVSSLMGVLDACDGAIENGAEDVEPIRTALLSALTSQGLERIDPVDAAFDPEQHEAVMHEPAEDGEGPTVAEVMRPGYSISGRVVRPAMVRVRG